jgi:hypothetical protein
MGAGLPGIADYTRAAGVAGVPGMMTYILSMLESSAGEARYPIVLQHYDSATGELRLLGRPAWLPAEVDGTIDQIIRDFLDNRRNNPGDATALGRIGEQLFQYVRETEPGGMWFHQCDTAAATGNETPMRTYLDIKPPRLQRLPWELMVDAADDYMGVFWRDGHRPMRGDPIMQRTIPPGAMSPGTVPPGTLSGVTLPRAIPATAPGLPIRVLVAICKADEAHEAQTEVDAIHEALGSHPGVWHVEVLWKTSRTGLIEMLRQFRPQVLHLIGETFGTDDPAFQIHGQAGEPEELRVDSLRLSLLGMGRHRPLLIMLNGCRTAQMASPDQFHRLGSRAVVTNQADVHSTSAVRFARAFYAHLADSGNLAEAMWQARRVLRQEQVDGLDLNFYDCAMPTLTVYGEPHDIIAVDLRDLDAKAEGITLKPRYSRVRHVVDRVSHRENLWRNIYSERGNHLLLVTGQHGAGKTQLLKSCLLTCKLRGSPAVLLDMERVPSKISQGRERPRIREVLLYICQELLADPYLSASTRDDLFALQEGVQDVDPDTLAEREATNAFQRHCSRLLRILAGDESGQPIIIALDHVEKIYEQDLREPISEFLLRPMLERRFGRVYMIIATTQESGESLLGSDPDDDEWREGIERIRVDLFIKENWSMLGHEYGARRGWAPGGQERWIRWIDFYERELDADLWKPGRLPWVADAIQDALRKGGVTS